MSSLSFDGLTAHYDETRTCDPACFNSTLDWIEERFPTAEYSTILEPGVGSGRIAVPLAVRGYRMVGVDLSRQMLNLCVEYSQENGLKNRVNCVQADTTRLPFADGSFDLAIVVHVFYFISNWREAATEIMRVLTPKGVLILMHTGYGAEVPEMNDRYKELAFDAGYTFPKYGVQSSREVMDYLVSLGYKLERVFPDSWAWISRIKPVDALRHLGNRAYSFQKDVPDRIHTSVMQRLSEEFAPGDSIEVANRISLILISRG
jgi:SAM-dependent methyltransferase